MEYVIIGLLVIVIVCLIVVLLKVEKNTKWDQTVSAELLKFQNELTKEIWVYDAFTQKGMTNDEIFNQLQEMQIHNARIVCDSAEQKSIEDLRRLGCKRVVACAKGRDSILNGINLISEYHVYVLPTLSNFKEELLNYTWQKDRQSGEYINRPIDKFNHCMDAWRYSIMDAVQNKKASFSIIYR